MAMTRATKSKKAGGRKMLGFSLKTRTSRCAGKCHHWWCAGYDAGYEDGDSDGRDAAVKERVR